MSELKLPDISAKGVIKLIWRESSFTVFAEPLATCQQLAKKDLGMAHERAMLRSEDTAATSGKNGS